MNRSLRVLLWLGVAALLCAGLFRLRFDVDVLNLLPRDVPEVRGLQIYQQHFANANELVVTIESPDAEKTEAAARQLAEFLRARTSLVASVTWQPPWLEHPGEATELAAYVWFNQPPEIFAQLSNRLAETNLAPALTATREQLTTSLSPDEIARLSYDPFGLLNLPEAAQGSAVNFGQGQELFASADGTFRILFARPNRILKNYRDSIDWMTQVKGAVGECRRQNTIAADVRIHFTGGPAFTADIAGGMQGDMTKSAGSALVVIVVLFWWAHRRFRPLLWLVALLFLILACTLAIGGLIFGTLGVVSVGFAAILLGLAVDYGMVLYQEFLFAPQTSPRQLQKILAPGIIWSAVTTAGAFATLNLCGLPGLAQLGSLVAIGVALAAIIMLNFYLPPLARLPVVKKNSPTRPISSSSASANSRLIWTATLLVLGVAAIVLSRGAPKFERTADSLRPRHSEAYDAMNEIKKQIGGAREPLWLLISGRDENEVGRRLDEVQPALALAQSNQQINSFTLPLTIWPRPEFQSANRATAQLLASKKGLLRTAILTNAFTEQSFGATAQVLDFWQKAAASTNTTWPGNEVSSWILDRLAVRTPTNFFALGLIYPATNSANLQPLGAPKPSEGGSTFNLHPSDNIYLAGWELLGPAVSRIVQRDMWRVMWPMALLLGISLWLAFKNLREVFLSLATLLFSGICLLALMRLVGWSWNLLNLMALPLLLGAGVDYSIHMQLALRRHGGNISETRRIIGRALLLCAGTTVAGFGSNVWSSNAGLMSLGVVCAAGIAFAYLTSNFLLPVWWRAMVGKQNEK